MTRSRDNIRTRRRRRLRQERRPWWLKARLRFYPRHYYAQRNLAFLREMKAAFATTESGHAISPATDDQKGPL